MIPSSLEVLLLLAPLARLEISLASSLLFITSSSSELWRHTFRDGTNSLLAEAVTYSRSGRGGDSAHTSGTPAQPIFSLSLRRLVDTRRTEQL